MYQLSFVLSSIVRQVDAYRKVIHVVSNFTTANAPNDI